MCAKYYRNWSAFVETIVKRKRVTVFCTTVYIILRPKSQMGWLNPLKCSGVKWLHVEVFSAIQF